MKNKKKEGQKRKLNDVLPTFEDVLGIGEEECTEYESSGAVLEEDEDLLAVCTQDAEV